jgi:hypothetical protein
MPELNVQLSLLGTVATYDEAVVALNPTERAKGKTIIRLSSVRKEMEGAIGHTPVSKRLDDQRSDVQVC